MIPPKVNTTKGTKAPSEGGKSPDTTGSDTNADKTGTDVSSDKTATDPTEEGKSVNKFDKPSRETDPDTTGIDTDSDKTKTNK